MAVTAQSTLNGGFMLQRQVLAVLSGLWAVGALNSLVTVDGVAGLVQAAFVATDDANLHWAEGRAGSGVPLTSPLRGERRHGQKRIRFGSSTILTLLGVKRQIRLHDDIYYRIKCVCANFER